MRYSGGQHDIDYAATLRFFDDRGRHSDPAHPETSTMYQTGELAHRRDRHEREIVEPLLAIEGHERVLDIGCGYGRWAQALAGKVSSYLGIDFSAELLRLAAATAPGNSAFQRLAAQQVAPNVLVAPPPFDLFLCSGILIYLNDADVAKLAQAIGAMAAPHAVCYLREPMAVAERLTLDRFPSVELDADYSAVYRTVEECDALFGAHLGAAGFRLAHQQRLYPPELCNRKETEQHIQIWRRL